MKGDNHKSANKQDLLLKNRILDVFSLKSYESLRLVLFSTIIFTITGIWQLIIISGFIGGFFCKRAKLGIAIGFIGAFLGWVTLFIYYVLTTEMLYFFEFWIETTMGYPKELAYLLMLISSLFGGFIGALGGLNGVRIKYLLTEKILKEFFY